MTWKYSENMVEIWNFGCVFLRAQARPSWLFPPPSLYHLTSIVAGVSSLSICSNVVLEMSTQVSCSPILHVQCLLLRISPISFVLH